MMVILPGQYLGTTSRVGQVWSQVHPTASQWMNAGRQQQQGKGGKATTTVYNFNFPRFFQVVQVCVDIDSAE